MSGSPPRTMRALVKPEPGEGLVMREEPVPEIGPGDVLIRVHKTGICGTDVHIWNWDDWAARTIHPPLVIGHEFAGEIAALGPGVDNLSVGQRVSAEGHLVGATSRASRAGRFHLDPDTKGVGVHVPGAFADYVRLPAFNVVPLPEEVDDEIGAILDPLGNAVHTVLSFDMVGEDVLITGAGPIGIMAAAVAKWAGARHVVITDVNPDRLALAGRVTPARPVNVASEDLHEVMAELGLKEGFDIGLEMSGVAAAFEQMVDTMIMGGRIGMLGLPPGKTPVDWAKIVLRALTIKGIYGREIFETWYKMIVLIQNGLDVRGIITHRLPAERFTEGFDAMRSGACGKVVLDWGV